jgi:hypothetical protein
MGMRIKPWGLAAVFALGMAGLAPAPAHAGNVLNFDLGSSSISGNFGTTQAIKCANGQWSTLFTFLSWNAFQGKERDKSVVTITTNAGVFVQQNNGCTGETTFDGAFVENGFTLTVKGIQSATLAGTIPLFSGRTLTMDLTITQTGSVSQGHSNTRNNVGPTMFIQRTTGSSCDASSISGSFALNGQNIPLVNLSDVGGTIFNHTLGQIVVIGARTFHN